MQFEISEATQKKFNIAFGVILVISNLVGLPLAIVNKGTKEVIVANRIFTVSRGCEEELLNTPSEFVSTSCLDEVKESKATIERVLKRVNDARSGN